MNGSPARHGLLAVISLAMVLEVVLVLAARFGGELGDRDVAVFNTAFGSIGGICAVLLFVLRLESVKEVAESARATVESVDRKADTAAVAAVAAKETAAIAARTVDGLHHDFNNGVLIQKILEAIRRAEADPEIVEKRIEHVAKGVQADRHETGSREQAAYARGVADAMKRQQSADHP